MKDLNEDVYFRLVPLKTESERQEVEQRARTEQVVRIVAGDQNIEVIGRPMTIETNMQSRPVTLILPIRDASLTEEQLKELGVFIEHSDGTKELVKGELVPYDDQGTLGLRFTVDKFSTFTVIRVEGWRQEQVHKAYISGYPGKLFGPDKPITRAEMAAMLARVMEVDAPVIFADYKDVPQDHWANEAISKAASSGLLVGYPDGSFKPEERMTRPEMAAIAATMVLFESEAQASDASGFTDVQGHWAEDAIKRAAAAGIVSGYGDGTFRPDQLITRAEAVTNINKLFDRRPSAGQVPSQWTDVPESHWAYGDIQEASVDHTFELTPAGDERWNLSNE